MCQWQECESCAAAWRDPMNVSYGPFVRVGLLRLLVPVVYLRT